MLNPEAWRQHGLWSIWNHLHSVTSQKTKMLHYMAVTTPKLAKVSKCTCCSCGAIITMEIQLQVFWFIFPVSNKQEQACSSHSSHTMLAMSVIVLCCPWRYFWWENIFYPWQSQDRTPKQFWKPISHLCMETYITVLIRFVKLCIKQWHPSLCCELMFYKFFLLSSVYFYCTWYKDKSTSIIIHILFIFILCIEFLLPAMRRRLSRHEVDRGNTSFLYSIMVHNLFWICKKCGTHLCKLLHCS